MANTFSVLSYSPKDVVLIIAGYQITGWERISIQRVKKSFTTIPGIRGKNTRVSSRDTSASLSFTILQTSQSNEVLSYIHELDIGESTGRLAITLKDLSGKSVFSSEQAYITGYPTVAYSGQFEYRAWDIFCETTKSFTVAGNSRPLTNLFDGVVSDVSDFVSDLL